MNENYLVTKSNYFIMNCSYDLSLEEQKLILTLASMVQPEDEEFKPYKFKISEFIKLLGLETQTKYSEIPKITKELMKKVFEIQEGKTLLQVAWLSSARYEKGSGYVILKFSPDLKPYMLQLKEKFTQYQLSNILSMKSKYSPRIYEILKCNEFKIQKSIEIRLNDLRKLLKIEDSYTRYNDFKRKILLRAQKELKKITDISFEFEEIKTGRKVTSIKFYIKNNGYNDRINDELAVTLETKKYIDKVKNIFNEDISSLQAEQIYKVSKGNIEIIKEKYDISKQTDNIKNLIAWIIKAIKEDYKHPIVKNRIDSFNDYTQRKYDYDKLERQLLGWECD